MQQKQGHPMVEDLAVGARRNSMLELDEAVVRGGDKTQKRLGARDGNQGPGPRAWPVKACCGAGLGLHLVGSSASLSSSSVSAFCEVVFVVERSPGFLPFPCLASRIGRGFALGSREVIDFFYRFVHGGPMAVWLSSFCDSMSATSSRMVGLSSMAFSNFGFGGCSLFVVVSHLLCPAISASSEVSSSQSFFVGHSSLSSSPAFPDEAQWRKESGSGVRYGWCLFAACFVRIRCSGLQVVRVLDLCFPWRHVLFARLWLCWCLAEEWIIGQANFYRVPTLGFTVASPSAASRLFRLGEASGKLCLLVV
ncbi:unnamed protein product [Brassica oleracea var. botrytis]